MKKVIVGIITVLSLTLIQSPANAEDSTYAVVNSSGVVTNVIVCSAAVCGPSGSWGGKMPNDTECPGCSLALQIAANTTTGEYQGAIFPSADSGKQLTYDSGTFTLSDANTYVSQGVVVESIDSSTVTTSLTATVEGGNSLSFTYEDTVGKSWGEIISGLTVLPIQDNVRATVSATEVTTVSTKIEITAFEGRKTAEEVSSIFTQRNLTLLQSKITKLLTLLDDWVK